LAGVLFDLMTSSAASGPDGEGRPADGSERFNLFLAYALPPRDHAPAQLHVRASEWLGLGLIVVGALMTILATWRYHRNRTLIASEINYDYTGGPQRLLTALVVLMAIFLVV